MNWILKDVIYEKTWSPGGILLQAAELVPCGLQEWFLPEKVSYYSSEYHLLPTHWSCILTSKLIVVYLLKPTFSPHTWKQVELIGKVDENWNIQFQVNNVLNQMFVYFARINFSISNLLLSKLGAISASQCLFDFSLPITTYNMQIKRLVQKSLFASKV